MSSLLEDDFSPDAPDSDEKTDRELSRMFDIARECCMPCKVTKVYEGSTSRVDVLILVKRIADDKYQNRPIIKNIPCVRFGTGKYSLRSKISVGDIGFIFACDRDGEQVYSGIGALGSETDSFDEETQTWTHGADTIEAIEVDNRSLMRFTNGFFIPLDWSTLANSIEDNDSNIKSSMTIAGNKAHVGVVTNKAGNESVLASAENTSFKIANDGLWYEGASSEFKVVTAVKRNGSSSILIKTRTLKKSGNMIVGVGDESGWVNAE